MDVLITININTMKSKPRFAHDLLVELVSLREKKDIDSIFEKLYQFILEPTSGLEYINAAIPDINYILSMMIKHFSDKEEFEKCAIIRNIIIENSNEV